MPKHKPIIAVTGSTVEKPFAWDWLSWQCIRLAIRCAGGVPVKVTPVKPLADFDGLLISGGVDIDPALYGQENVSSHKCESERDQMELELFRKALAADKPVLGICRGAQMINIAMGGDLHQEANKVFRYYSPAKTMLGKLFKLKASYITDSKWMREIFAEDRKHYITSLHHQTIGRLGDGLIRIADDHHGMTQAIEGKREHFLIGMQWHPEFELYFPKQLAIFRVFVETCRR